MKELFTDNNNSEGWAYNNNFLLININYLVLMVVVVSVTVGSIGGINQTSLREILTYSSINHTGSMLIALAGGRKL
jgi:NADH-ubiquinone oxidoreductase chain 2